MIEAEINLRCQGFYGFSQKQGCCLDLFNIEMLIFNVRKYDPD